MSRMGMSIRSTMQERRFSRRAWVRLLVAVALTALGLVWVDPVGRAAAADLVVSTPYPSVVARPGSTVKFDFKVAAPAVTVVGLKVGQLPDGWKTTLRGGGFVVNAVTAGTTDSPGTFTAEVDVPQNASPNDYSFQIIASDSAGDVVLPLSVQVQAEVDSGVGVTADFPSLRGEPGTAFSYTLTVTNNTPESQTFTFTA